MGNDVVINQKYFNRQEQALHAARLVNAGKGGTPYYKGERLNPEHAYARVFKVHELFSKPKFKVKVFYHGESIRNLDAMKKDRKDREGRRSETLGTSSSVKHEARRESPMKKAPSGEVRPGKKFVFRSKSKALKFARNRRDRNLETSVTSKGFLRKHYIVRVR